MLIDIQFRSDTQAKLTARVKPLKMGEPAYETDTRRLRIGDGVTAYADLPIVAANIDALTALSNAAVAAAAAAAQSASDAAASAGGGTAATHTVPGVARLATTAEALAGTDDAAVITPADLAARIAAIPAPSAATTTAQGIVELATTTETTTGTDTTRAVTPAGVAAAIAAIGSTTVPDATTSVKGKVQLATNTEASTGTDTAKAVTAAGVAAAITARSATTAAQGIVELATVAEAQAGTDTSRAVTPAGVAAVAAGLSTVKAANISDATAVGRALLTAPDAPTQVNDLGLGDAAHLDGDNVFTGTVQFPAGAIDPSALGPLDGTISAYNDANRIASFRTFANGTTPAVIPNTVWAELAAGVPTTPVDTLLMHLGDTTDATTYSFDPGTVPAAAVYTLAVWSGLTAGTGSAPCPPPLSVSGRSLTVTPIEDPGRTKSDGVTTSGSATVTSATMAFVASDVGRLLIGAGIPAGSRIVTVNSATSVTISANATASATGVQLKIAGVHSANGILGLTLYRLTGTPDSSGNVTVTFPSTVNGCLVEMIATSSVNPVPADAAYNGQASGFGAPTVDLGSAPATGAHELAFVGWNSGSSTITTDPGTPFGTSPDVSISAPVIKTRSSVVSPAVQAPTWAKSDSSQEVTAAVTYTPS